MVGILPKPPRIRMTTALQSVPAKTDTIDLPMLIPITVFLFILPALALVILRILRPNFRFFWLIALGGALLGWISLWIWLARLPLVFQLPRWQPADLFFHAPTFTADGLSWPFAISLGTLALSIILTAVVRQDLTDPMPWAGALLLTGVGVLAVTANNPLTLVLVWAALDLSELLTQLRSVETPEASERIVVAFASRVTGIGLVLWANVLSVLGGSRLDFASMPADAGLFLLIAAGLRLGVLPLHLPYTSESKLRRGVGTAMRLTTAASSLVLLARIPPGSVTSPLTPYLFIFVAIAAVYSSWTWLRAPDELAGRPFWVLSLAALALASALSASPAGVTGWGVTLVLAGGALFLNSVQQVWLNRAMLVGALALSTLPFTLTASAWDGGAPVFFLAWPLLIAAQTMTIAGFARHALRPGSRESLDARPSFVRIFHPLGIGLLLLTILLLGFLGWDGALRVGNWIPALLVSFLTVGLVWAAPRLPFLNPIRAHWIRPSGTTWADSLYRGLWSLYQGAGRLSDIITNALEGEGGLMWSLLFLALFVSFMSQAGR